MTDPTTKQLEETLRASLTSIRRDWNRPDLPDHSRGRLGATTPIPASRITRMSIHQDIAFWVNAARYGAHACLTDYGADYTPGNTIDMTRALLTRVRALSGWEFAKRMAGELEDDARALRRLTHDEGLLLGPCPVEVPQVDADPTTCGREVRAHLDKPSDVRCPGCGTNDTIEGWQRRMVGDQPVTATELAPRLIWLGQRVEPDTIRQWVTRGVIPPAVSVDEKRQALYDPVATMRALMAREQGDRRVAS